MSVATGSPTADSEAGAQLTVEGILGDHDASLDQDLLHRDIEGRHQTADVLDTALGVLHQESVGARVDGDAATLGEELPPLVALKHGRDLVGLGKVDLHKLGAQRLQLLPITLGLHFHAFARRDLLAGGDVQNVAIHALVEAPGLQDNVQRLIPRHVVQAQGDVAAHGIADHDVQVGEVRQQLQDGTHLDVLEIQRQAFALEFLLLAGAGLALGLGDGRNFQHELAVTLIGNDLVFATRLDFHTHPVTLRNGVDGVNRSGEVDDIESALQVVVDHRAREGHLDPARLFANVDLGTRTGKIHLDAALAFAPATEINARNLHGARTAGRGGRLTFPLHNLLGAGIRFGNTAPQREDQVVAFHPGLVLGGLGQIKDHAGAVASLDRTGAQ